MPVGINSKNTLKLMFLITLAFCSFLYTTVADDKSFGGLEALDANSDGIIDPYEALDVLLTYEKETGKAATINDLHKFAAQKEQEQKQEAQDLLSEFDTDGDGAVKIKEVHEEAQPFAMAMDSDQDGTLTLSEVLNFNFEDIALADEEQIQARLDEIFQELDADENGSVDLATEVSEEMYGRFAEQDINDDKKVSRDESYKFLKADNTPVEFTVEGNTAYMTGVITASLPSTILRLLSEHPEVEIIEMIMVPGSIDDEANLRAAMYVQDRGLTTKLNAKSSVASGGTDFFMAGKKRIVEKGASLGVHSWGGGGVPATEVPKNDPVHQKYLDFYTAVGVPTDFYWYTLEAAPASEIHIMTEEEIETYKIRKAS